MARMSAKERKLAETLADPVLWGQAYLRNRDGGQRAYWSHQAEDLLCPDKNIIHLDGRDVGKCLVGSTLVVDCDTGERVRMDKLRSGRRIAVLGPDLKITSTRDYAVLDNGSKRCFRLQSHAGRTIECTANHPFLSERGWVSLSDLKPGDWLAVPRYLPVDLPDSPAVSDEELILLAYLIADGSIGYSSVVFTKEDTVVLDEFRMLALQCFPETKVTQAGKISYRVAIDRDRFTLLKNPCKTWLAEHGLMGCRSAEKFVPDILFGCSRRQIGLFLSRLFTCDGWICFNADKDPAELELGYCSASEALARGVIHLLLRVGILANFHRRMVNNSPYWSASIACIKNIRRFARHIGLYGPKQAVLDDLLDHAEARPNWQQNPHDRVPASLVAAEIAALRDAGWSTDRITGNPNRRIRLHRYSPTRRLTGEYAENTGSEHLHDLAVSDIYWDRVARVEETGERETFDLSVPGFRNFIADEMIVHNSVCISTDALHFAFTQRGGQGLVGAPHQGHLDTLIEEIEFQLDANPDLMASIAVTKYGKLKIHRKPYFRLEFTNGAILYFRPAGAYGDAFRSLHVDRVWVDEGAWLTERAWKALRQCLKSGGRLRIYSTPNGLRNTTYYRLTGSSQFRVFRWPSWLNPAWNEEREAELLEFYGGRDSAGWQHEVAGEHGKPSYGAFNVEHLNLCRQDVVEYQKVVVTGDELRGCATEEESHDRLEMLLNLTPRTGIFWIGGDLGYTNDPTEIVVFQEVELPERRITKLVLRVHMEHVAYPHIAQTIALLDRYFLAAGIGMDNGGNGLAVVQELLTLDKYKDLALAGRLRGYDFGGMTTLAVRDGHEIRKRTKEFMTSLIAGGLQRRQLVFPIEDLEIEDQFTTHTYTLHDGRVVYSKGNDHIIDAVRCAMLAREQADLDQVNEETVSLVPLTTEPIFI